MFATKKMASWLFLFALLANVSLFAQEGKKEKAQPEISKAELTKFSTVFDDIRAASRKAQQEMVRMVENEGLEMKRFNEIHTAYINPNMESDATPEEQRMHDNAMKKIEKRQAELQTEMDAIVKKSGLSIKEYQRVAGKLQTDMALRKRYMEMAKNSQKEE